MKKEIKCKHCDSTEFITALHTYDVYGVVDGKLELQSTETVDNGFGLYCRECSEELEDAGNLVED